jgi:hypothetical protein
MFSLLIVARSLNWDPALPPEGSGLLGFEEALLLVNEEPFLPDYFALKTDDFL